MSSRMSPRRGESSAAVNQLRQQHLPFTSASVDPSDFSRDLVKSPPPASLLSSSYGQRTPARSFFHHASHGSLDSPQYASHGVRDKTQELASYALESKPLPRSYSQSAQDSELPFGRRRGLSAAESEYSNEAGDSLDSIRDDTIDEIDEPTSSHPPNHPTEPSTPPMHTSSRFDAQAGNGLARTPSRDDPVPDVFVEDMEVGGERRPLLPKARLSRSEGKRHYGATEEESEIETGKRASVVQQVCSYVGNHSKSVVKTIKDPETWSSKAVRQYGLDSLRMTSAVFLGLLLNILDGLSYGLILFPLGEEIFAKTGPDGISIFFVSCIVSQLVYSCGASIFKGGVGSEMIEVVPFFHSMAFSILADMGDENPQAVLATVIVSYAASSIMTGMIFLALGLFKLGNLVSFFPRNILTGCVGGVGFFLFLTGIEVSARIDGSLEYNLVTLKKLFELDTVFLWTLPLFLAIFIVVLRQRFHSPLILPAYFIVIVAVFYTVVKGIMRSDLDRLRDSGWIFEQPESGVPFWHFYTYFDFALVDWSALAKTIPTMLALSFFGIIHVPINVPALGVAVKEDDVNINRELIAHGLSNTLSGCVGSIQNYLVYANSVLFIGNGGDSRLAGLLLAAATTAVWVAGPGMIGFIPVNVVGTLIFMLGIELLLEAVWEPFGKLHKLEYLTIVAIVLIMGIYDFVVGIVAGIILACLNYVVQTSNTPAIRATYSGEIAESTVRRPPVDRRYLNEVRSQIWVEKLSGYLFFGSIVSVESEIRALIDAASSKRRLIRYVIIDFGHVTGIDFSAAEAFTRMNRILTRRNIKMMLSGVSFSDKVGSSLGMVGLLEPEGGDEECPAPEVYEDLNNALEACENGLLDHFYRHREAILMRKHAQPVSISPPKEPAPAPGLGSSFDAANSSPRRGLLHRATASIMADHRNVVVEPNTTVIPSKWKLFAQPVKIMLQTFEDVSSQNEDFWHRAAPFFERREYAAGTVLYSRGDEPDGFYLLEEGRFRADYYLEQGRYSEVILPGTTCGELPFFSETDRTGTVAAERDCVAWLLTRERFREMESKQPDVARELLKIGLKLTSERMNCITSYVLVMAS